MSEPVNQWLEELRERYDVDMLKMDGYDDCIAGVCERFGQSPVLIYDLEKIIAKMMKSGMTREEAVEFYEFNQLGAWMGDGTPAFLTERPEAG